MIMHFENLWEKCEELYKNSSHDDSSINIVDEIVMKFNLYRLVCEQSELSDSEKQKIKSHTLGEILLSLTNLSLKDNINVYEALGIAYKVNIIKSSL